MSATGTNPMSLTMDGAMQAFCMVGIAEIFDKTWFVALLMALKHDKNVVFWGCFLALAAHVGLAGVFGAVASNVIPLRFLHFAACALYTLFSVLFFKDYLDADPDSDIIAAGKEEAAEDCEGADKDVESYGAVDLKAGEPRPSSRLSRTMKLFGACFVAMFIAEWGDRTQIAMLGVASAQPVLSVVIGSLAAFFVLTLSAVIVGGLLGNARLSEKIVHLVSSLSFAVFAALALHDGMAAVPVDMR